MNKSNLLLRNRFIAGTLKRIWWIAATAYCCTVTRNSFIMKGSERRATEAKLFLIFIQFMELSMNKWLFWFLYTTLSPSSLPLTLSIKWKSYAKDFHSRLYLSLPPFKLSFSAVIAADAAVHALSHFLHLCIAVMWVYDK